jgi:UDP-3-O-[3-hydroxymyristoyl] glucosamine N-acyltransferase
MAIRLRELAQLVEGDLLGNAHTVCVGAGPLGQAAEGEVTMLEDPANAEGLAASPAVAVVTPRQLDIDTMAQVVVDDPHRAFAMIVAQFRPPIRLQDTTAGIHPSANIDSTAQIHPSVTIGADVIIGPGTIVMPGVVIMPRCVIGRDCVLHANVTLYEYSRLGDRVVLHGGCVVGAHGFGYRQSNGRHVPAPQLGFVEIASDVEAGALVTIDRGTYGATSIGEGTKIDNQVMIAHNCQIGRHNLLCSQVGIAGSCSTGDHVVLAGQVGLKDHVHLGDATVIGAQSGVMDDLEGDNVYLGSPAVPLKEEMQLLALRRRMPEMRREIKMLRRELASLITTAARLEQNTQPPERGTDPSDDSARAA